jgi:hypothetical protein
MGAVAIVMAAPAGCSSAGSEEGGFGATNGAGANLGAGTGTGAASGTGGTGPIINTDGGDTGGPPAMGCSADLQNVIDGNGVVIQACAPDKGCAGGQCVPPCEAAAASKGSVGCDFVAATPSFHPQIKPPCFAVFLANNWPKPVTIQVSRQGQSFDVTKFGRIAVVGSPANAWQPIPPTGLAAGQVGVLFLSHDPQSQNMTPTTCPVAPAVSASNGTAVYSGQLASSGRGRAWHIVTSVPVSAYDMLPFGGAKSYLPSAELLLPTTAWGTNYVAVVPVKTPSPPGQQGSGAPGPQWGLVVASADGTEVKIAPTSSLPAGAGVSAAPKGQVTTYSLGAGELIQWQDSSEMTGSVIESNKPVAFVGGNGYLCYGSATSSGGGCDSGHQMIPPVSALGFEYVAVPYATRRKDLQPESIAYRIVGAVDGTQLVYEPAVQGAPSSLDSGKFADFESKDAFVVHGQDDKHPFYLGQRMAGCGVQGGSRPGVGANPYGTPMPECLGDEEYVNILPPAQFLTRYVFLTDPTYATANIALVRVKIGGAFQDVEVECFGKVSGWKDVGGSGKYQVTDLDLVRGNAGNGKCNNGPQLARSAGPFGIMVWGEDWYASYAYPAGGNVAPINTVFVPPIPK